MQETDAKWQLVPTLCALPLLLIGFITLANGLVPLLEWKAIQFGFAAAGIIWVLAALVMWGAAVWLMATLGRQILPLRIASGAVLLTAAVLIIGTLSNQIPCDSG